VTKTCAVKASTGTLDVMITSWASESVMEAGKDGYSGIKYGKKSGKTWPITFKDRQAYDQQKSLDQGVRIAQAGLRLAQVLTQIWPGANDQGAKDAAGCGN
jgi:hypothetical protein